MKIRLVPFEQIDRLKWDSCIHYANNGNLFGYHWYLKNTIKEFDGLVEGNYESVMPLIRSYNRLGQKSLIHPKSIGRLGVFSVHVLSLPRMTAFIEAIPKEYRSVELLMNEYNKLPADFPIEQSSTSDWYRLNLDQPYEVLKQKYDSGIEPLIESTHEAGYQPSSHFKVEKVTSFLKQHNKGVDEHLWHRIHYNLMHRGTAFSTTYINRQGDIQAAGLFAYSNGYFVSLYFAAKANVKQALYYRMLDDLIQLHAGRPLTLDFNTPQKDLHPEKLGALKKKLDRISKLPKWERIWKKAWPL